MSVSVIIPAYNEADRIAETVLAAKRISSASEIIVVDDGSCDDTGKVVESAGADRVIRQTHRGKGAALNAGVAASSGEVILMLDADLGESASQAEALIRPVVEGETDVAIASFPNLGPGGGLGFAVRISRNAIERLTGQVMASPLSGQRAFRREVIGKIGGFAPGFAAETAMTIDALRAGFRVTEVPLQMTHRRTGLDIRGFLHRGRQLWDIWRAVLKRSLIRQNFRGDWVPIRGYWLVAGLAGLFGMWWLCSWNWGDKACASVFSEDRRIAAACFWLIFGMGAAGFIDDVWGSRDASGFLGHFGELVRRRRVTTGVIKVLLGGLVALIVAAWLFPFCSGRSVAVLSGWHRVLLDATVIALSANLVNILDLRPGRAAFAGGCVLAAVFLCAVTDLWRFLCDPYRAYHATVVGRRLLISGPAAWVAFLFWERDSRGRVMLGDCGAMALGAFAGLVLVLMLGTVGELVLLALLIAIHVYSEKRSISATIEGNRILRWIDRRTGVR